MYSGCNHIFFLTILFMNIGSIIIVARLVWLDRGDVIDELEQLNGFAGCYETPYINFDVNQLKNEFNSTSTQVIGKILLAVLAIQVVLSFVYVRVFLKTIRDARRVEEEEKEREEERKMNEFNER